MSGTRRAMESGQSKAKRSGESPAKESRSSRRRRIDSALDVIAAALKDPSLAAQVAKARKGRGKPGAALANAPGLKALAAALAELEAADGVAPVQKPRRTPRAPLAAVSRDVEEAQAGGEAVRAEFWADRLRGCAPSPAAREAMMAEMTSRVRGLYKHEVVTIASDLTGGRYRTKREALAAIEHWLAKKKAA